MKALTQKQRILRMMRNDPCKWFTSYEICKHTFSTAPATIISQLRNELRLEGKFELIDRKLENSARKEYKLKRIRKGEK